MLRPSFYKRSREVNFSNNVRWQTRSNYYNGCTVSKLVVNSTQLTATEDIYWQCTLLVPMHGHLRFPRRYSKAFLSKLISVCLPTFQTSGRIFEHRNGIYKTIDYLLLLLCFRWRDSLWGASCSPLNKWFTWHWKYSPLHVIQTPANAVEKACSAPPSRPTKKYSVRTYLYSVNMYVQCTRQYVEIWADVYIFTLYLAVHISYLPGHRSWHNFG